MGKISRMHTETSSIPVVSSADLPTNRAYLVDPDVARLVELSEEWNSVAARISSRRTKTLMKSVVLDETDTGKAIESTSPKVPAAPVALLTSYPPERALAHTLPALRIRAGLTQAKVATFLGTSQTVVSRFEQHFDHRVLKLMQYVRACGGRLQIMALVNGQWSLLLVD